MAQNQGNRSGRLQFHDLSGNAPDSATRPHRGQAQRHFLCFVVLLAHARRAAVLDGIPVRWVTVLRGSELGVLRGRQSRHIRHRSDMTKLAGVDHSADRLTTPSATSSSTTLTTRPLASYNTALGWPSTQASRIQAPRTRPRRSRPTSSRMTRYRRASGFPIACALPPPYQHRPLHRREGLQQHQERHGQRVGQLGARPAPGRRRARRPARAASPPRTSPAAPAPNSGS